MASVFVVKFTIKHLYTLQDFPAVCIKGTNVLSQKGFRKVVISLGQQKILLSVKEFAQISGLGANTIRTLAQIDGFPALRNGRRILIHRRAADAWLEARALHKDYTPQAAGS